MTRKIPALFWFAVLFLVGAAVTLASCCPTIPPPADGTNVYNSSADTIAVNVGGVSVTLPPYQGVIFDPWGAWRFGWTEGYRWRLGTEPDSLVGMIRYYWNPPPTPGWGEEWTFQWQYDLPEPGNYK